MKVTKDMAKLVSLFQECNIEPYEIIGLLTYRVEMIVCDDEEENSHEMEKFYEGLNRLSWEV